MMLAPKMTAATMTTLSHNDHDEENKQNDSNGDDDDVNTTDSGAAFFLTCLHTRTVRDVYKINDR